MFNTTLNFQERTRGLVQSPRTADASQPVIVSQGQNLKLHLLHIQA